ncbi:hypothetical protein LZ32DRAFT_331624 [Colletotrichum eremochloae]|nr:hypothetical protein LZ32DRAFT_331624 [Colletotrichum eremochloae]
MVAVEAYGLVAKAEVVGHDFLQTRRVVHLRGLNEPGRDDSHCQAAHWAGCYNAGCRLHDGSKQEHHYNPKRKWNTARVVEPVMQFLGRIAGTDAWPDLTGQTVLVLHQSASKDSNEAGILEQLVIVCCADDAAEGIGRGLVVDCKQLVFSDPCGHFLNETTFHSVHLVPATRDGVADVTLFGRQYCVDERQ